MAPTITTSSAPRQPEWHDQQADLCEARRDKATPGGVLHGYLGNSVEYHRHQARLGRDEVDAYVDEWLARAPITEAGL